MYRAYSLGLLAFMLIKVLAPGFYARQDTRTPVAIGIKAMAANMIMNLVFVVPLYMIWNIGHVGLALATSLAAYLNAGLLFRGLRREQVFRFQAGWSALLRRLLLATLAMSATLFLLLPDSAQWLDWGWRSRSLQLGLMVLAGLSVYLAGHLLLGARLRDLYSPNEP